MAKNNEIKIDEYIKQMENLNLPNYKKNRAQEDNLTTIKSLQLISADVFPLKIDFKNVIQKIIVNGVQKQIAIQQVQQQVFDALNLQECCLLAQSLFWTIFGMQQFKQRAYPEQCQNVNQVIFNLKQYSNAFYFKIIKQVEKESVNYSNLDNQHNNIQHLLHDSFRLLSLHTRFQFYLRKSTIVQQQICNQRLYNCFKTAEWHRVQLSLLKNQLGKTFQYEQISILQRKQKNCKDFNKDQNLTNKFEIPRDDSKRTQTVFFQELNQCLMTAIGRKSHKIGNDFEHFQQRNSNISEQQQAIFQLLVNKSQCFQHALNDQELPQKSGLKIIKHHIQKFDKDTSLENHIEQMKSDKDKKQRIDFKKTQTIVNNMHSSYQKHQLFNINVFIEQKSNDIDASYLNKYPKYAQYYQNELELKVILEKNDYRMTDLRSSKIALHEFNRIIKEQKDTKTQSLNKQQDQQQKQPSDVYEVKNLVNYLENNSDPILNKNSQEESLLEKQTKDNFKAAILQANKEIQDQFKDQPIYQKKNRLNMLHNISNSIGDIDTLLKFQDGKSEKQQLQDYFKQALLSKKRI